MSKNKIVEHFLHPFNTLQTLYKHNRDATARRKPAPIPTDRQNTHAGRWREQNKSYFDQILAVDRINTYLSYMEMERDPLMAAMLDYITTECTQPNTEAFGSDAGRVVWCYSRNPEIQRIVTQFLDRVEVDELAFPIIRSTTHLGDHFEEIIAQPNDGIIRLDHYEPWIIAQLLDAQGRVKGYTSSDERGLPVQDNSIVPFYKVAHFTPYTRKRKQIYGYESSLFWQIREYWQEAQWMMDKIIIERFRRADRLLILLDVGGMSAADAWETIAEYRRSLYRDEYFDNQQNMLSTVNPAWGEQRDYILPTGADNRTSIQTAPASNTSSLEDLNLMLKRLFAACRFPASVLGLDLGDNLDKSQPIGKQDLGFARQCSSIQRRFLRQMTRLCAIDLAYRNINPNEEKNQFCLLMTPVSVYEELERKDVISLRYDLLDRSLAIGRDNGFTNDDWIRYVLLEHGRIPEYFVNKMFESKKAAEAAKVENPETPDVSSGASDFKFEDVNSYFSDNPEKQKLVEFLTTGSAIYHSGREVYQIPRGDMEKSLIVENPKLTESMLARERIRQQFHVNRFCEKVLELHHA